MSIVSINEKYSPEEFKRDLAALEIHQLLVDRYNRDPVRVAQEQGRDMVEHFGEFVQGTDNGRGFSAYFMHENPHHVFQREGFWDQIRTHYPDMVTVASEEEPDVKLHLFQSLGVFLRAENRYYQSGEPCGVHYTAHHLEAPTVVGKVAAAHLMQ